MAQMWYKDAIFYGVDVETFQDSNADGIGDFAGLTSRLDYLVDLGVTCLWLLPFYPTPNRDNGYDISDFRTVDPRLGTLDDFRTFLAESKKRSLRVLIDLVANHTSDQHPWFQEARQNPLSKYRDYYIWTAQPPAKTELKPLFPGIEESVWQYDIVADAYYFHLFYKHQPDLNHANPEVRREFQEIMAFWLDIGVDGFRIDAAPHLIHKKELDGTEVRHPHDILKEMRRFVSTRNPDAVLLAEADTEPRKLAEFFGKDDEMHLLFNFYLCTYLFLALAQERAEALGGVLRRFPDIRESGEWVNFLRNLDELTLVRLSNAEREQVYNAFAPQETMRIYNRGIRRRLAPMLTGDRRRMELAYSLLFAMPGTPLIVYGDEIGMGDDLSQPERNSVRTPMQWNHGWNAGFSTVDPDQLIRGVIRHGIFSYERVNVEDQQADPGSFFHWLRRLIAFRKNLPEIGSAKENIYKTENEHVLVQQYPTPSGDLIIVHNLRSAPCEITLDVAIRGVTLVDIFGDQPYHLVNTQTHTMQLNGFGYRWLREEAPTPAPPVTV